MNKRDLGSIVSLLVIPGAGMELYESIGKFGSEYHPITWWDYAKYFFLAVACVAALVDLCSRIADVIDSAGAAMIAAGSFFYLIIFSGFVVFRGLLGYGWSTDSLYVVGGLLLAFVFFSIILVIANEREEREKAELEKELMATGGPEAVQKQREADAIAAAEGRAWMRARFRARE